MVTSLKSALLSVESLLALESMVDGQARKEIELVFYTQFTPEQFVELQAKAISTEIQEQFSHRAENGTIRMRACTDRYSRVSEDAIEDEYILTTKVWSSDDSFGKSEVEVESSRAMFMHFKTLFTEGMYKQRFRVSGPTVSHPDQPDEKTQLVYEVDVFFTDSDAICPWVKIDLELPEYLESSRNDYKVLPEWLQGSDLITAQHGEKTPEIETQIKSLYRDHFSVIPQGRPRLEMKA
jgi:hypothetical protein